MKHIHCLEEFGLIRTHKKGRIRMCVMEEHAFVAVESWLAAQRAHWEARTDRLEQFVMASQQQETAA